RHFIIEFLKIAWSDAFNLGFTSYPKQGSGLLSLFFSSDPDWLTQPPSAVSHFFSLVGRECPLGFSIVYGVSDDPIGLRVQTCGNRVMIWKCKCRKGRCHPLCAAAALGKHLDCWAGVLVKVVGAIAVYRNEDYCRLEVILKTSEERCRERNY